MSATRRAGSAVIPLKKFHFVCEPTVGYLPPPAHQQLCEYMKEESLSESAALVKIVKQFCDGSVETKAPDAAKEKDEAMVAKRLRSMVVEHTAVGIAQLKVEMTELKRRFWSRP